jgi:hypothetical protein
MSKYAGEQNSPPPSDFVVEKLRMLIFICCISSSHSLISKAVEALFFPKYVCTVFEYASTTIKAQVFPPADGIFEKDQRRLVHLFWI